MTDTKSIQISDYDYNLPDERIAKFPVGKRDDSKLLLYADGNIGEDVFHNLTDHLNADDLMVFNNTKVIQARLYFRKPTGALIEVFLLEPLLPSDYEQAFQTRSQCTWQCIVGNLKKWKTGQLTRELTVGDSPLHLTADRGDQNATSINVEFTWDRPDVSFAEIIDAIGELPIPPYLNRATQESDKTTYQTVYSRIKGSVAAPTAGLHFTQQLLAVIDSKGISRTEITLHVGAGTFKPVKSQTISGHDMHTEHFCVTRQTIAQLLEHHCQAVAVGTTSVRTLESLYYIGLHLLQSSKVSDSTFHVGQWEPYSTTDNIPVQQSLEALYDYLKENDLTQFNATTQIIIAPGYKFKIVDRLITNFHQPQSTLLLLVSALIGDDWRQVYQYALDNGFRFLSYGDSSLLKKK